MEGRFRMVSDGIRDPFDRVIIGRITHHPPGLFYPVFGEEVGKRELQPLVDDLGNVVRCRVEFLCQVGEGWRSRRVVFLDLELMEYLLQKPLLSLFIERRFAVLLLELLSLEERRSPHDIEAYGINEQPHCGDDDIVAKIVGERRLYEDDGEQDCCHESDIEPEKLEEPLSVRIGGLFSRTGEDPVR